MRMRFEEAVNTIPPGRYRHFKGGEYEVLCIARHSETEAPMVVYQALYGDGGVWCRPAAMWNEQVARNGVVYRRFYRLDRIERVERYERLFDEASASHDPETLRRLDAYYTSGEWREDFGPRGGGRPVRMKAAALFASPAPASIPYRSRPHKPKRQPVLLHGLPFRHLGVLRQTFVRRLCRFPSWCTPYPGRSRAA